MFPEISSGNHTKNHASCSEVLALLFSQILAEIPQEILSGLPSYIPPCTTLEINQEFPLGFFKKFIQKHSLPVSTLQISQEFYLGNFVVACAFLQIFRKFRNLSTGFSKNVLKKSSQNFIYVFLRISPRVFRELSPGISSWNSQGILLVIPSRISLNIPPEHHSKVLRKISTGVLPEISSENVQGTFQKFMLRLLLNCFSGDICIS